MQPEAPWGQSTRWLTCLTIDPKVAGVTREQVRLALEAENIEARARLEAQCISSPSSPAPRCTAARSANVSLTKASACLPAQD
jgi:hypothetical protein